MNFSFSVSTHPLTNYIMISFSKSHPSSQNLLYKGKCTYIFYMPTLFFFYISSVERLQRSNSSNSLFSLSLSLSSTSPNTSSDVSLISFDHGNLGEFFFSHSFSFISGVFNFLSFFSLSCLTLSACLPV